MIVYIVVAWPHFGYEPQREVIGAFSTEEQAYAAADDWCGRQKSQHDYEVIERVIDAEP